MISRFGKRNLFLTSLLLASEFATVVCADDYVREMAASASAKAHFTAIPENLPSETVLRKRTQVRSDGKAFYTDDGAISIPPGAMVCFSMEGKCMDPHLPAPADGEPMQFVNLDCLIPTKLRETFDNLITRMAKHDPKVLANNPQHLVWAIRTAGTDSPFADNLSDAQIEVLDECAGRRGAFVKYHEKEKRRNARKRRRSGAGGTGRVSVGGLAYDASELSGSNGVRLVESHIAELTELGKASMVRTSSDFRYGEIEEALYSDVVCEGTLSFKARILNTSESRKEFKAADFAAQVGNGGNGGGMRQRVTMEPPAEFTIFPDAARKITTIEYGTTEQETEGTAEYRIRRRSNRRQVGKNGTAKKQQDSTTENRRKTIKEEWTTVTEVLPVCPVAPVKPVEPIVIETTNTIERIRIVPEKLSIRIHSLEFNQETGHGTLVLEIVSGTFSEATHHIRKNIRDLVREGKRTFDDVPSVPSRMKIDVVALSIDEDCRCKVEFADKTRIAENQKRQGRFSQPDLPNDKSTQE